MKLTELTYLLLRVVSGLLFFQAGSVKFLGWFGGVPAEFGGQPALTSLLGIGGIMEFFGGILIMLGCFTRPVAFLLSGEMAVAYFKFHQPDGFWPVQNHGGEAVLFCFIFLYMAARGGGDFSVDGLRKSKRAGA